MADAKVKPASRTPCSQCPWRDKPPFRTFTAEEAAFVQSFKAAELVAEPGTTVLLEGQSSAHLFTVLSGWAFRYKSLPDGRRQILNFVLPGDFLGLQTAMLKEMDHSVEALTELVLCVFPRQKVWALYNSHPGLAFDLTWIASREERILDERLLSVGRRSAIERVAHVLLHLYRRARSLGLTRKNNTLALPLTQQHLADALGLSLVHTNKTLRRLTDRKLFNWKDGLLSIVDEDGLAALAHIDPPSQALRPLI